MMYDIVMNDLDSPLDDRSNWNSCTASISEMSPQDFEVDYDDAAEFSITSFLISAAIFSVVVFIMFRFM